MTNETIKDLSDYLHLAAISLGPALPAFQAIFQEANNGLTYNYHSAMRYHFKLVCRNGNAV